jgi:hypothetical protein
MNDLEARKPEVSYMPINVMDPPYNVKVDGVTDDTLGWQTAINALPTTGGELVCRRGFSILAAPLNLVSKKNVRIKCEARAMEAGGYGTTLLYTGSGTAAFFDARMSEGLRLEGIQLVYNNSLFTGTLVDLRNTSGSGTNDTAFATFDSCWFGGSPGTGGTNSQVLVDLDNTHSISFRDCSFMFGQIGVRGKSIDTNYSNGVLFERCLFEFNFVAHTKNAGDAWHFDTCVFSPLNNGQAGVYRHDANVWAKGMLFTSCWAGDILVASGPHIQFAGRGLTLIGGEWAGENAACTSIVEVNENNCSGITVLGVSFTGPSPYAVKFGAVTGTLGVLIGPCDYLAGIVPSDGAPPNSLVCSATGRWQFGNNASANLYQDGAGTAGLKTDGYFAAVGTIYGSNLSLTGDVVVQTAGRGLQVREGTNAKMGVSTLVAGTVTVSTTAVTATSRILLTGQNSSGTHGELTVSARTAGTSFTITSSSATDTRSVAWIIMDPAP